MYSQFSLEFQIILTKGANFLGFLPIGWNKHTQRFEVTPFAFGKTYFNFILIFAYTTLLIPYNINVALDAKDYQEANYTIVVLLCGFMGDLILGILVFRAAEICQIINGFYLFLRTFQSKHEFHSAPIEKKSTNNCNQINKMLLFMIF